MITSRKQSLASLCIIVMLFSIGFGVTRVLTSQVRVPPGFVDTLLVVIMTTCYGAAIGGLVREMKWGVLFGLIVGAVLVFLSLPTPHRE